MLAFLFPGQGSQRRGMGGELFGEVDEFKNIEREVDRCLGYSVRDLCLEDKNQCLKATRYAQPALYVVNALCYYRIAAQGERPDFVAGHSVGEYNALCAAGVFDFLTGLRLVQKRAELMAQNKYGGMAAIIGLSAANISELLAASNLGSIDIANYNSTAQTVISGPLDDINRAGPILENSGAQYIPLQVSAAFHSRYMENSADLFGNFISSFVFNAPKIPVLSNVLGVPYPSGDPTAITRYLLIRQINRPVQWVKIITYLLGEGVQTFKELGPGNVLTKLAKQIEQEQPP